MTTIRLKKWRGILQAERKSREYKSFYKTVGGNEGDKCKYPTRLDVYGCGCAHDCGYCYAKSLLDFRGLWNPNNPSVADIEKIKRRIKKIPKGSIVRLGGMTDCFQPCEQIYGVAYETIKAMNEAGIGYLIVTKSAMIAYGKYFEILDKDLAHIQITITTLDDELARSYEHSDPPSERIKAIEKLYAAGFDVTLRLSPFIPRYVDLDKLSAVKCDKILIEFLRINSWIARWLRNTLDIDYSEYCVSHGGYWHMPLGKKIEYVNLIKGFKEVSVCEDEDAAYQYWRNNFNPNKNDCCNLRKSE